MLTALTLTMMAWFTGYVYFIHKRYGKLTSISASTYKLAEDKDNYKWLFWIWLVGLGAMNLAQGMDVWGFGTSVGLMFTGITVDHDGSFQTENTLHTIAAFSAIILGVAGMYFLHGMLFPFVVIGICALALMGNRTYIWDMEVIALFTILFSYLLR
jgi:hypothetical protein